MAQMDDCRKVVLAQIRRAGNQGRPHVEINAGELRRAVYLDAPTNRPPMACSAMRESKTKSDEVIFEPPAWDGASFTVRYNFPKDRTVPRGPKARSARPI